MSGKKMRKKEIQQNPFKRLKGFCVSLPEKANPAASPGVPLPKRVEPDETDLFADEMNRLGVTRQGDAEEPAVMEGAKAKESAPNASVAPPSGEQDLFLASLGTMDAVFADETPAAEEIAAVPRRMRQVRRGELVPEARLDLHGLSRPEARERVRHFLDNSVYQGRKTVLIVTGRGKGSAGEPVLRAEIERYLRHDAMAWVAEWGRAPARYGGEGALVVFLKGNKKTL